MRTFAEKDAGLQAVLLFGPSSITQGTAATIWIGQPRTVEKRTQSRESCSKKDLPADIWEQHHLYDSHAWFSRDAIQLGGFFRVHLPLAYKAEERLAEATETIRYVGRGTWKRCSQWRKHLCYLDPTLLSDTKGLAGHLPNLLFHDDR